MPVNAVVTILLMIKFHVILGIRNTKDKDDIAHPYWPMALRHTPSVDFMHPNFIRIQYLRYADDFVISIAGPYKLAMHIRNKVREFLTDTLKLNMNLDKSHITHFTKKPIQFLGVSILNRMLAKNKPVILKKGQSTKSNNHST